MIRTIFAILALLPMVALGELKLSWTNNLLRVSGAPGGDMEIWYLEAFCRPGAFDREWGKTVFPHQTVLVENDGGKRLKFRTTVQGGVEVEHTVTAGADELDIRFALVNKGTEFADIQWFQPACIRVEKFTGRNQSNYIERSFIFTEKGLTTLAQTKRTEEALYKGGQVYLPKGTDKEDSNPRPISHDTPVNGLVGCYSADGKWIMATASDKTHELFEGVYVCLHSDPRIDGLKPGEKKQVRSKIYFVPNDVEALIERYKKDFSKPSLKGAEARLMNAEDTRAFIRELFQYKSSGASNAAVIPSDWEPTGDSSFDTVPGSYSDAASAFQVIHLAFTRSIAYKQLTGEALPKPENMVWAGKALQALRDYPDVYEHAAVTNKGEAQQIYFRDLPEGQENPFVNAFSFRAGQAEFRLSSTRSNLLVQFETDHDRLEFAIHQDGRHGKFKVGRGKVIQAVNDLGEKLDSKSNFEKAKGTKGSIEIPYSGIHNQPRWITGAEHGKYVLECAGERQGLYFASEEEPVRLWLEHELGGGLTKWRKQLKNKQLHKTDGAHLHKAAELWLKYLGMADGG